MLHLSPSRIRAVIRQHMQPLLQEPPSRTLQLEVRNTVKQLPAPFTEKPSKPFPGFPSSLESIRKTEADGLRVPIEVVHHTEPGAMQEMALKVTQEPAGPPLDLGEIEIHYLEPEPNGEATELIPIDSGFHEEGALAQFHHQLGTIVAKLWPEGRSLTPLVQALRSYANYLEDVQKEKKWI